jgi:hypothetical protein
MVFEMSFRKKRTEYHQLCKIRISTEQIRHSLHLKKNL